MELSKDSTYDEVCAALAERLKQEGQAEALGLEDPQQLRFTGQQSWTATIPKSQPFKHHAWDTLLSPAGPSWLHERWLPEGLRIKSICEQKLCHQRPSPRQRAAQRSRTQAIAHGCRHCAR